MGMDSKQFGNFIKKQQGTALEDERPKLATVTHTDLWGDSEGTIKAALSNGDVIWVEASGTSVEVAVDDLIYVERLGTGTRSRWRMVDWFRDSGGSHTPTQRGTLALRNHTHDGSGGEGGASLTPDLVDLDGAADALVFDADGDTSMSAPTDDEIDVEVGGADVAEWKAGGLYQAAGIDAFPDGEGTQGLFTRTTNRLGIATYTDHFRSGSIPTGFSWISDGDFNGTPASLTYNYQGTYLSVVSDATPHFLADAITVYADKSIAARMRTGYATEIGLRLDDGSDDNYVEIILDPDGLGGYNVDFRHRAGGGAITDTSGPYYPATELVVVRLLWSNAGTQVIGYTLGEDGQTVVLTGFATGLSLGWTPARVGIKVQVDGGNAGIVDWFYSDFS